MENNDGGDDVDENNNLCVICMSQNRNVILNPCRHVAMCKECA